MLETYRNERTSIETTLRRLEQAVIAGATRSVRPAALRPRLGGDGGQAHLIRRESRGSNFSPAQLRNETRPNVRRAPDIDR
jgi:hypothetical protein